MTVTGSQTFNILFRFVPIEATLAQLNCSFYPNIMNQPDKNCFCYLKDSLRLLIVIQNLSKVITIEQRVSNNTLQ